MKPVQFSIQHPRTVEEAIQFLADAEGEAKIMAGGQSLGPMLNLRLAQASTIIDISGIPELTDVIETDKSVTFGACITHAAIEDCRVLDPTHGFMSRVAAGIAYRAVRNRGTIAGSIVHADPSADWVTTLNSLRGRAVIAGANGLRSVNLADFMVMPFSVTLEDDEFVTGIQIPKLSDKARFGYFKFCRKRGEFATAMASVVVDEGNDFYVAAIGATGGRPLVLNDISEYLPVNRISIETAVQMVKDLNIADETIQNNMHAKAFGRAMQQVAL